MRRAFLAYFLLFLALSILEFFNSIPDSFVLFTISITFAYSIRRGEVYALAASIIAIAFAILSTLSIFSSLISYFVLHSNFSVKSQLGVFGFTTLPLLRFILKQKS